MNTPGSSLEGNQQPVSQENRPDISTENVTPTADKPDGTAQTVETQVSSVSPVVSLPTEAPSSQGGGQIVENMTAPTVRNEETDRKAIDDMLDSNPGNNDFDVLRKMAEDVSERT